MYIVKIQDTYGKKHKPDMIQQILFDSGELSEAYINVYEKGNGKKLPSKPYYESWFDSAYAFLSNEDIKYLKKKYNIDDSLDKEEVITELDYGSEDILIYECLTHRYNKKEYFSLVDYREEQGDYHIRVWEFME